MATLIPVGTTPGAVCITSDGRYVWVANRGDGTIQKIDTETLVASPPITVGSLPSSIIMSTDQDYVYVVNSGDNTISVVNTSNNVVTTSDPFGSQLVRIVASPNNNTTLWVLSSIVTVAGGDDNLFKLTRTGGTVVVTEQYNILSNIFSGSIYGITISHNGNYLYLSDYGRASPSAGTSVFQYNISTPGSLSLDNTYTVGANPSNMVISSDDLNLYVQCGPDATSVYRINTNTPAVTPIPLINGALATGGITISSDNQYVWVTIYIVETNIFNVQQIYTPTLSVSQANTTVFFDTGGICVNPTVTALNYYIWVTNQQANEVVRFAVPFSGPTPPCFPTGVRIRTTEGYKQVEEMTEEDRVVTSDGRAVAIKVFSFSIPSATEETAPYRLSAGCLGYGCPVQDICLSGRHAIQDGRGIWQIPSRLAKHNSGVQQYGIGEPVTYYHIECPNFFTDHLVAEGSVVESFRNRQGIQGVVYVWDRALLGFTRPVKEFPVPKNPETLMLF